MMADTMQSLGRSGVPDPTEGKQDMGTQECPVELTPIIGIPILVRQSEQGPQFMADAVGAWSLERMGARLLLVPLWPLPTHEQVYQSLWPLMQSMDGLLLPAGTTEPDEVSLR